MDQRVINVEIESDWDNEAGTKSEVEVRSTSLLAMYHRHQISQSQLRAGHKFESIISFLSSNGCQAFDLSQPKVDRSGRADPNLSLIHI